MAAVLVDVFSGFAAGVNVTLVGHPFDTVKVRLQTQPENAKIYSGFVDCVRKTIQWEGVGGLYKGVTAPLAGQLFFRSALFMTNATYLRRVGESGSLLPAGLGGGAGKPLTTLDYGLGGSIAWATGTLVECPLNVVASQMQVQIVRQKSDPTYKPEFTNVGEYARGAPSKYGLRALYAGILPHLIRNVMGGFFHFGAFEYTRREYAKSIGKPVTDIGLLANMGAGSVGGFLFWFLTYPFDLVKGAMQGDGMDAKSRKYTGMVDAFGKLYKEGGPARFTRGFSACILRSVPANAVMLTTAFRVKEIGYEWAGVTPKK